MTKTIEMNAETGKEILRDMTADEQKSYDAIITLQKSKDATEVAAAADKTTLLSKLGITADEAKLLVS